jgi:hypothetical protein
MELQIVSPDPKYPRVKLIEPTTLGYLHIAAVVSPPSLPFMPTGRAKSELLTRLKALAHHLEQHDSVEKVTVFDAIAVPPLERLPYVRERADAIRVARFDIVVLVEAKSPAAACAVQTAPAYQALVDTLRSKARRMHVFVARNAKRIGDVDNWFRWKARDQIIWPSTTRAGTGVGWEFSLVR